MSPIKEDLLLQSIRSGVFSYKRKPDIIKYYSLYKAINKMSRSKLAKEIAYCLCTYSYERLKNERYYIALNGIALSDWSEVAVLQLTPSITSFSNLICVDYKAVNDKQFRKENEVFFKVLYHELKLLQRETL